MYIRTIKRKWIAEIAKDFLLNKITGKLNENLCWYVNVSVRNDFGDGEATRSVDAEVIDVDETQTVIENSGGWCRWNTKRVTDLQ